jgi:hypothetical protein
VAAGERVRSGGGAVHRHRVRAGADLAAEGGQRDLRAAGEAPGAGGQAARVAGRAGSRAGAARVRATARGPGRAGPVPGPRRTARSGFRRGADVAAAAADLAVGDVLRFVLHGDRRLDRAAAGQAAGHLARRVGACRAAPGRAARGRLARIIPHPRGGGRRGAGHPGGRGGREAGSRARPLRAHRAGRLRRRARDARGGDRAAAAGCRTGIAGRGRVGGRQGTTRTLRGGRAQQVRDPSGVRS